MNKQSAKYENFVLVALFGAIIFVLAFTPVGFINLVVIKATIIHIPVIIGSILLGPKCGAVLGGFFGLASLINNYMTPSVLSFAFCPFIPVPGTAHGSSLALIICFVPRILVGVVPYCVYYLMQKISKQNKKNEYLSLLISGILGSMTNTILVMSLIYFLFKEAYATASGIPVNAVTGVVLGVVFTNGVPEAIVAALITVAVCKPLLYLRTRKVQN